MREYFESIEDTLLKPYAVKSKSSLGRYFKDTASPTRTCFQRDRDRIIHSKAFRRLKHKTQVFLSTENDHYRSRLTHSLEVAQISRHIARLLGLNEDLCEAIALSHDLGHPPFGHSGETILNTLMADNGGYEHNIQSLRIVTKLEKKYPHFPGLNLSQETLFGLMKHKTAWDSPPEITSNSITTLEAQVVNIADEIAYNNHDLDDGLNAQILNESHLDNEIELWHEAKACIQKDYQDLATHEQQHLINSHIISAQVMDVCEQSKASIKQHQLHSIQDIQTVNNNIIEFSSNMKKKNQKLRKYLYKHFYLHPHIYRMNKKGQQLIQHLFHLFNEDTKTLPLSIQHQINTQPKKQMRLIADYISGMTDTYVQQEYISLLDPHLSPSWHLPNTH